MHQDLSAGAEVESSVGKQVAANLHGRFWRAMVGNGGTVPGASSRFRQIAALCGLSVLWCCASFQVCSAEGPLAVDAPLWEAKALTPAGGFTEGIEGPACDRAGNVYAVNFERQHTIGRTEPGGKTEVFVTLPQGSTGNGIVFSFDGMMYVADYTGHNVLRIHPGTRKIEVYAHDAGMNQPNDLALAPDGTLYASDPDWKAGTGQIWRFDQRGKATKVASGLGTSNGIEVSPDGKTLYLNESVQRNVWAWTIDRDGSLKEKRLVRKFDDFGFDGMRADVDGQLYITRHGKGTVVKLSPGGAILREIGVLGSKPSNLCFGGPDGKTVYVTEVEHQRLVAFRVDRPGLAWQYWKRSKEAR